MDFMTDTTNAPTAYLKYKLDRVFIKSWSTSGDAASVPTEQFSLNFEEIKVTY